MLEVYACIVEHHDVRLVGLAAAICLLSALAAVVIAKYIRQTSLGGRFRWILLTGYVTGVGVWATHFVGMLAYQPHLPTAYAPAGTAISLAASVAISVAGWWLHFSKKPYGPLLSALVITAGVATMHFIGMGAMLIQGSFRYDLAPVIYSILGAGVLIWIAMREGGGRLPCSVQAFALTAGTCLVHFGVMAAVTILPDSNITIPRLAVSRQLITFGVASAVLAILVVATFAVTLSVRVRRASDDISRALSRDLVTGVLNTSAFERAASQFLSGRKGGDGPVAVVRIALGCLGRVEEEQGREQRDHCLVEVAKRMEACVPDGIVGRLGSDEFIVLLCSADPNEDLDSLVTRFRKTMAEAICLDGKSVGTEASMGLARYPDHGDDIDQLRRTAGFALYNARLTGPCTFREYESSMGREARARHGLEADLRNALRLGQFSLDYQPIACVTTGGVVGFEALLRWKHPTLGMISPDRFVPVAEAAGLIVDIGSWVLVETCRNAAKWKQPLKVAVNLSAVQFLDAELVGKIRAALASSGLDPTRLELEITEGLLIDDAERAIDVLHEIKALGVRIAMDDFGTGFSSLSYFRQFPFDKVKIDQSFVKDMIANRQSLAIIRAVIGLGRALNMVILAEGVETAEQLDVLAMEGCQQVQGFLIGKPADVSHFADITDQIDAPSHYCGHRCEECLERLRPPVRRNCGRNAALLITTDSPGSLAA